MTQKIVELNKKINLNIKYFNDEKFKKKKKYNYIIFLLYKVFKKMINTYLFVIL
jgi:hypothetical protein